MDRGTKLFLVVLFAFSGSASAGEIKLSPGTWSGTIPATKVTIIVDTAGRQTVIVDPSTPLTITGGGGGPTVPPIDPPGPSVGLEASAARLTREALNAGGTPTTAAGVSTCYKLVGDSVSEGKTTPESALPATNFLLDGLLSTQADKDKWTPFRTGLGLEFDRLRQDGVLKTKEQWVAAFAQVSKGINGVIGFNGSMTKPEQQVAADAGILDKIDIAKLMELIKFLLELWKLFSAAQVGYVISAVTSMS